MCASAGGGIGSGFPLSSPLALPGIERAPGLSGSPGPVLLRLIGDFTSLIGAIDVTPVLKDATVYAVYLF
jgi:hypothetical protein